MHEQHCDWDLSILDRDTLMTGDGDFMTKEKIKADCSQCMYQNFCINIVEALDNHQWQRAEKELVSVLYPQTQAWKTSD